MKAILRSFSGVTREIPILPPPPASFMMAVSNSGAEIWNPHDLMGGEEMLFKRVKFLKKIELPNGDWMYQQEEEELEPGEFNQITKLIVDKLRPAIKKAITSQNMFYDTYKSMKADKPKEPQMTDDEATKLVVLHKKIYGYNEDVEAKMAALGPKVSPDPDEEPYEYLTRLYHLVTTKSGEAKKLDAKVKAKIAEYAQQEKQYQIAKQAQLLEEWKQQQKYAAGIAYTSYVPHTSPLIPAQPADDIAVPPKVEPKKELPDPIEPKKRLMKRS